MTLDDQLARQLAELSTQGAIKTMDDARFYAELIVTFNAKPKRLIPTPDIRLTSKERKKRNIKTHAFACNYIADYPWAMWETLAIYDPQWSGK